ncbi:MAG TPA: beta-lactamase family protein [Candidatus Limiplasma pullicola]|nr:beta-lactamase family protein [Candidatus Limiplasma pullicola]
MYRRMGCLLLLVCLALPCAGAAEPVGDQLARVFEEYSTLGASVAVFQNGRVTYTYTCGQIRPDGPEVTADTAFQAGSISKMVACIGLLQLMDDKGVSLDDELGDVLGYEVRNPYYPEVPVTLRQLMTHTASLRDASDYDDALEGEGLPLETLLVERARAVFSRSEPGHERVYSNFGGGLIGPLIEALSGMALDDYMAQNVFEPLGVTAAYQASRLVGKVPLADMYLMPEGRLAKRPGDDASALEDYCFTAGKLVISAPDLCKILIALCDGGICGNARILKESQVAEMTARQDHIGSVFCDSGNGLFLNVITDAEVPGRTLLGHGGKAYGMLCAAYFDPTDRTGVVMLTNGCDNRSDRNGIGVLGREILTLCYQEIIDPLHQVEDPFEVR